MGNVTDTKATGATHHTSFPGAANQIRSPQNQEINSHHIQFKLKAVPTEELNTVVGASLDSKRISDNLKNLAPRLQEVAANGTSLISFGSIYSYERISAGNRANLKVNSSGIIEQILAARENAANPDIVELSPTTRLTGIQIQKHANSAPSGNWLSGTVTLEVLDAGNWVESEVHFQEFCPDYDGTSLSAQTLLTLLDRIPHKHAFSEAPHFYSANGIGRSASLAVLCAFRKSCAAQGGFNENQLQTIVQELVNQGRQQRNSEFVNTPQQYQELLSACATLNKNISSSTSTAKSTPQQSAASAQATGAAAPGVAPAGPQRYTLAHISQIIKNLTEKTPDRLQPKQPQTGTPAQPANQQKSTAEEIAIANRNKLPYMPIRAQGIVDIANEPTKFPFPQLSVDQAKKYAGDVIRAGFYGDALGAGLESKTLSTKETYLLPTFSRLDNFWAGISNTWKENILRNKLHHVGKHNATDDTQQGVLSMFEKMKWMLNPNKQLEALPKKIMDSFTRPKLPTSSFYDPPEKKAEFIIEGGARTLRMCQDPRRRDWNWEDRCMVELKTLNTRAGGAGNGAMMRIGYDLLPLLASKATMHELVEQVLLSNQVTHPSSLSAIASVGQIVIMAKCMHLRSQAELTGKKVELPENFFIDTFYEVALALESNEKFELEGWDEYDPNRLNEAFDAMDFGTMEAEFEQAVKNKWTTGRLPSELLKGLGPNHKYKAPEAEAIRRGSVQEALDGNPKSTLDMYRCDAILKRWNSRSYLGATLPSVIFMLEKYGYDDPARAVELTALITKDSDTCATIVAQTMGALHGSGWIRKEDTEHFEQGLAEAGGKSFYPVENLIADMNTFYDRQAGS
ncbi:ADP-ribosylglycohydrolase family protein [Limnobacter parvus]|uniref:ADP-ribosylglycohydrolase family protein n=1 Tax=Limnobacter parvus TaxID=2939690 RepID=A0ABT1XFT2_9BURK|nr:ADP-ribosylglycohydrolase family protein [Limnobacter parvus]MCR2746135.1 ADP-ribosylglycohydrolase family protein [Limnobacter parvus]